MHILRNWRNRRNNQKTNGWHAGNEAAGLSSRVKEEIVCSDRCRHTVEADLMIRLFFSYGLRMDGLALGACRVADGRLLLTIPFSAVPLHFRAHDLTHTFLHPLGDWECDGHFRLIVFSLSSGSLSFAAPCGIFLFVWHSWYIWLRLCEHLSIALQICEIPFDCTNYISNFSEEGSSSLLSSPERSEWVSSKNGEDFMTLIMCFSILDRIALNSENINATFRFFCTFACLWFSA